MLLALVIYSCSTTYKELQSSLPDMNSIPDGGYRGNYSVSGTPIRVTLDVTVQSNRIIAIKIVKHVCSPIVKKAEKIIENIIDRQSLDIDAVSGATASSKGIQMAVQNALQ
jgi:uncharacterized protein with FMN-binding domain